MHRVHFDHLSATAVLPEVFEAMKPYFCEAFGNPSSLHQDGLHARDALAKAREQIATLINAGSPDTILFTSGGTEAANLAVKGTAEANRRRGRHIVVSAIEHPAVLGSVAHLEAQGFTCTRVGVDAEGAIDPGAIREAVTDQTILIAVHQANHDLGTLQPVREIAGIAAEREITLFVDATTSGGWTPIDVQAWGVDLLSLAPHRFHGPKGAGVLYHHRRARLAAIQHGGAQEEGRRAGTENVPAIVGAGRAAELAHRELADRTARTSRLQQQLWNGLSSRVPHLRWNGPAPGPRRLSTSLNFSTEFIEGEGQMLLCDLHGIALASGTICVSPALKSFYVLTAIGLSAALAQASVILSLGQENTDAEVAYFLETFCDKVVPRLRSLSPAWEAFQQGRLASELAPPVP